MMNHVVYQYKRVMADSNFFTYIGSTTCSWYESFKMHTQTDSFLQHLLDVHNINRVPRRQLLDKTEVIAIDRDKRYLKLEALLIKVNNQARTHRQKEESDISKYSYIYRVSLLWQKPCPVIVPFAWFTRNFLR